MTEVSAGPAPGAQFRLNNFDLIRLLAAIQVVLVHAIEHMAGGSLESAARLLSYFPGVPVFFFISGFLISRSYESNSSLVEYGLNRALRLFPALIVCTLVSLVLVWLSGYFDGRFPGWGPLVAWFLSQVSFVQFYNPDFFRDFGVGVINGSLWSITVEIQFYIIIPLMYWVLGFRQRKFLDPLLGLALLVFMVVFMVFHYGLDGYQQSFWYKLAKVSFLPWLGMFLMGVLVQRHFGFFYRLCAGKALVWMPLYLLAAVASWWMGIGSTGNVLNPALFALLCLAILSLAYSAPGLSGKLLGRNDISYGVYIYHMPIINLLLYAGFHGSLSALWLAVMVTVALAALSWRWVEKPSMKLKRHAMNPLG